ncbi:MAG TPA: AtpZ/AtpI family protein [Puia sp.]
MENSPPDNSGDPKEKRSSGNRRELLRYAGLSSEVFVSVGLSLFIGIKADKWVALSFPIFSWALPLLVIVVLIIKLVKETSRNKDEK